MQGVAGVKSKALTLWVILKILEQLSNCAESQSDLGLADDTYGKKELSCRMTRLEIYLQGLIGLMSPSMNRLKLAWGCLPALYTGHLASEQAYVPLASKSSANFRTTARCPSTP